MEDNVPCLHPVDPQDAYQPKSAWHNPGAVTLIDVTLAAHNRQHGGPDFSVGASAILRAWEKHDIYCFSSDDVLLARDVSFSVRMLQQYIPVTLAYSSATLSKHYQYRASPMHEE